MSFAVLYLPLVAEFGGSRGEVAAAQSVSLLLGGFTAPPRETTFAVSAQLTS